MNYISASLPIASNDVGLANYLYEIRKFPSLEIDEEYNLAKKYIEDQDIKAAHILVTSHLKLVPKIASSFKGYGLPIIELISEGNIGLMQAVKKFDPDLGFRLSTYAVWWIKASIQEYILKSWSLVKIGTTAAQKKLFFNLGKIKKKLRSIEFKNLSHTDISTIASELNVSTKEVTEMNNRMFGGDISLNNKIGEDSNEELIDFLPETRSNQETFLCDSQELSRKKNLFQKAMETSLNQRQRDIINKRLLTDPPFTLESLSQLYKVSRERIRQIEAKAFETLKNTIKLLDQSN